MPIKLSTRTPIAFVRRAIASRRHLTGSKHPPPPPAIAEWIQAISSQPVQTVSEEIDALRSRQLQATLPTRVLLPSTRGSLHLRTAGRGDALPKGHHLAYFQPENPLSDLAEDGSSTEYNAPAPYLRRMWAGGSFEFNPGPSSKLRIGDVAIQQTSVKSVEFKKDMIFVNQQRDLFRSDGHDAPGLDQWAVREVRSHVFRRNEGVAANTGVRFTGGETNARPPFFPNAAHIFTYTPSAPLLFRFSALTFNGHRIHYDRDWTRKVEGHPNLVVHGPLTALLLIELAEHLAMSRGKQLVQFDYRATSPMYVDLPIHLACDDVVDGIAELRAEQEGKVGMKATATFI